MNLTYYIRLRNHFLFILLTFFAFNSHAKSKKSEFTTLINNSLDIALLQSIDMAKALQEKPDRLPKTIGKNGQLETCSSKWWVSGFYPGVLWYLYDFSKDEAIKKIATDYTLRVEKEKYTTDNHDVGFMIFCSFGNAYRLTNNEDYKAVIKKASESLITRYTPEVGCIRSWDHASWNKQWQYPVIIDNMMNLEMLMWAAKACSTDTFAQVAISHANTTMKNHFRDDFSSFHVISYDPKTGEVEKKNTAQGFSDSSAWARGQGWALYGYTMMYRFTKDKEYLNHARHIASFILNHPNLPEDKIPYWDFDAPNIPNALRDASAGALICSALIELSEYVGKCEGRNYLKVAETQIKTLCSPEYLAKPGENQHFILKHSVGHMPQKSEIDVPLTYADYYFVEALMRYKKLKKLK